MFIFLIVASGSGESRGANFRIKVNPIRVKSSAHRATSKQILLTIQSKALHFQVVKGAFNSGHGFGGNMGIDLGGFGGMMAK